MPIPISSRPTVSIPPIAVFVHVHYPCIWREMATFLAERLTVPFHLVVTTSLAEDEIALPLTDALLSSRILRMENRGRDIRPFLVALSQTNGFEIGLKLHTKKSPQRTDGDEWREELLSTLLPPAPGVGDIVARLSGNGKIGLVTPDGFSLSVRPWIFGNWPGMRQAMSAIGYNLVASDLRDIYFSAGSMFWFRRSALLGLADPRLLPLFEPEGGQLDSTLAHAIERLFPIETRRRGQVTISVEGLLETSPGWSPDALQAFAARFADKESKFFPAAGPAAVIRPDRPIPLWATGSVRRLYLSLPRWLQLLLKRLFLGR